MLLLEQSCHCISNFFPKCLTTFFVDPFIAENCKLLGNRCKYNKHRIAVAGLRHAEFHKLRSSGLHYVITMAGRNVNPNLAGRFPFRFTNCGNNPVVVQMGNEFLGFHLMNCSTNLLPRRRLRNFRHPRKSHRRQSRHHLTIYRHQRTNLPQSHHHPNCSAESGHGVHKWYQKIR